MGDGEVVVHHNRDLGDETDAVSLDSFLPDGYGLLDDQRLSPDVQAWLHHQQAKAEVPE